MNQGLGAPKCGQKAKKHWGVKKLVIEYRQSSVGMISEAFGISSGIVNLVLDDKQQLHEEKETKSVDQW